MLAQEKLRHLESVGRNSRRERVKVIAAPGASVAIHEYVQPPPNDPVFHRVTDGRTRPDEPPEITQARFDRYLADSLIKAEKSPDSGPLPGKGAKAEPKPWSSKQCSRAQQIGGVFDELYPPQECVFFTGTCPGRAEAALEAFTSHCSTIRCNFLQWLRDNSDWRPSYMFKWERHKNGVLHWHACAWVGSEEAALRIQSGFKDWYVKCLEGLGRRCGVDLWARLDGAEWIKERSEVLQCDAQVVQSKCTYYVAKYTSKGIEARESDACYSPPRWFTCSRNLSRELKRLTLEFIEELHTVPERKLVGAVADHILSSVSNYSRQYNHLNSDGITHVHRFEEYSSAVDICAIAVGAMRDALKSLHELPREVLDEMQKFGANSVEIELDMGLCEDGWGDFDQSELDFKDRVSRIDWSSNASTFFNTEWVGSRRAYIRCSRPSLQMEFGFLF